MGTDKGRLVDEVRGEIRADAQRAAAKRVALDALAEAAQSERAKEIAKAVDPAAEVAAAKEEYHRKMAEYQKAVDKQQAARFQQNFEVLAARAAADAAALKWQTLRDRTAAAQPAQTQEAEQRATRVRELEHRLRDARADLQARLGVLRRIEEEDESSATAEDARREVEADEKRCARLVAEIAEVKRG